MVSDLTTGDSETPELAVSPFDSSTAVTLTVTAPDGTTSQPTVFGGDDDGVTRLFTASVVVYDQPYRWLLSWRVTGTGQGVEVQEVWVNPLPAAGGQPWTPGRSRVADYVIGRTVATAGGRNVPLGTFDDTTTPAGALVDQLIADGVEWVQSATGPVHPTLYRLAGTCAAMWAAWSVELSYPDRDSVVKETSTHIADRLLARVVALRADLVNANAAAGEVVTARGPVLLPTFAFPPAPRWADLDL